MPKSLSIISQSFFYLFVSFSSVFAADEAQLRSIVEVTDFSQLGKVIAEKRLPMVLMFSSEHCIFCRRVEDEFLIPMQISGDYTQRALIRKVKIDYGHTIRDFDGKEVDADEFAERYDVTVTPTLVFLDGAGNQLAPRQVGLTTVDFYGGYLDESIDIALDLLHRTRPLRVTYSD